MTEPALEERVARLEGRTEGFEARFDGLEGRMDRLELRLEHIDAKLDRFREELTGQMERQFQWLLGVNVVMWTTVMAGMVAFIFRS